MKKTYKNDKATAFLSPKQSKIPILTHAIANKAFFQLEIEDKSDRQVNVVCPNCVFHFKIQLKLLDGNKKIQQTFTKQDINLQKLIEHQFSLIPQYSKTGVNIQNSPILRLKNQQHIETVIKYSAGLQRLQKLNQLSQFQKSRLQESKVTQRFNISPKDSPDDQYESMIQRKSPQREISQSEAPQIQRYQIQTNNIQSNEKQSREIKSSQRSIAIYPQKLKQEDKQLIKQTVFDYFEMAEALRAVLDWIGANQHYNSLPTYVRYLINTCQEKLNATGYE